MTKITITKRIKNIKNLKKLKGIILILSITLLGGCSEMNSQFDCPMKPGIRCESIDSVNSRIDRGEIGNAGMMTVSDKSLEQMSIYKDLNVTSSQNLTNGKPLRFGETVQRVWVAPFEDKQGNYHQESNIYTVTKPGKWIGAPLKEITEEGE